MVIVMVLQIIQATDISPKIKGSLSQTCGRSRIDSE